MPLTELFVARFADEQGVPRPKLSADLSSVLTPLRLAGQCTPA
ncbi:transcriptional regulator TyrR [Salmonella enterica subsp. arizonae]|uniref:Transcriptional regulator TyrR n=1 Tax=Salmonella enterica subsp. arizonae TaxID=59203 RepID=A0A379TDG2_SALER|nr:transcriptional regulator TyrR [Salmonella enterica subsp. arizonae]